MENPVLYIDSAHWFDAQLYLAHNYATHREHYTYQHEGVWVRIEFKDSHLAGRFLQFFAQSIKAPEGAKSAT